MRIFKEATMKLFILIVGLVLPMQCLAAHANLDTSRPIYTQQRAVVCPLRIMYDNRVGHDVRAALDATLSTIGHDDNVRDVGCEVWKAGVQVFLGEPTIKQIHILNAKRQCTFVFFGRTKDEIDEALIFSCHLTNKK
jgi:hypothetical protein